MKKVIILICILLILPVIHSFSQSVNQIIADVVNYRITVDDIDKQFENPIVTINDRVYIPLREVAETLGMNVEWDEGQKAVEIHSNKQTNAVNSGGNENSIKKITDEKKEYINLFRFRQNRKYGYMDSEGNVVVEAQFDRAFDEFDDGMTSVWTYEYEGNNSILSDLTTDEHHETIRYGFVGLNGQIIQPQYANAGYFREGLALVIDVDGSKYYIDKEGNKSSIPVISGSSAYFSEGFAPSLLRYEMEDFDGQQYEVLGSRVWSYVDVNGELATDKEFQSARGFSSKGVAIVRNNDKFGLIDTDFNMVVDYRYDMLSIIDIDLYYARIGTECGIIDSSGNVVVDFVFEHIGDFSDGLAPVKIEDENWAYINRKGELFFEGRFVEAYAFVDGYAKVITKETIDCAIIDTSGEYLFEPMNLDLRPRKGGLIEEWVGGSQDYYYVDLKGNYVYPKLHGVKNPE